MATMTHRSIQTVFLFTFLCLLLTLTGCPKRPGGTDLLDGKTGTEAKSPLDEAKEAYMQGNYSQAETVSMRLTTSGDLSSGEMIDAYRVLAASALGNSHPSVSLSALDGWHKKDSAAENSKEWQDLWCKAMRTLPAHDARTRANDLYVDKARSVSARSMAGIVLAVRQWDAGEKGGTFEILESIYTSAATALKGGIESRLAKELSFAGATAANLVATAPASNNAGRFPYSIILIDKFQRQIKQGGMRTEAEAALKELRTHITLADPTLFNGPPPDAVIAFQVKAVSSGNIAGKPVVLLLPLSGQYGSIAGKIVAGAQAACDEMSAKGTAVSLLVIDTELPDWLSRLNGLPGGVSVVGGPLRRDDYVKAKSQGILAKKAFFAFLPGLEQGDEGRVAWRFFASAKDQVDTLLKFTSGLGIKSYGVFYPDENFGKRMAGLFEQEARSFGATTVKSTSYAPKDQTEWLKNASDLVSGNTGFKAIFLPDTWKNMDIIVPNIFYYNENRQVLLGTSLWEQGLASGAYVNTQNFGLAVFPGSWNKNKPTAAGEKLRSLLAASGNAKAEFWSGLGYDFARFAIGVNIGEGFSPAAVNAALQNQQLSWSIAPIRWDPSGIASQDMFLFTPKEGGFASVNESEFNQAFKEAWR